MGQNVTTFFLTDNQSSWLKLIFGSSVTFRCCSKCVVIQSAQYVIGDSTKTELISNVRVIKSINRWKKEIEEVKKSRPNQYSGVWSCYLMNSWCKCTLFFKFHLHLPQTVSNHLRHSVLSLLIGVRIEHCAFCTQNMRELHHQFGAYGWPHDCVT